MATIKKMARLVILQRLGIPLIGEQQTVFDDVTALTDAELTYQYETYVKPQADQLTINKQLIEQQIGKLT